MVRILGHACRYDWESLAAGSSRRVDQDEATDPCLRKLYITPPHQIQTTLKTGQDRNPEELPTALLIIIILILILYSSHYSRVEVVIFTAFTTSQRRLLNTLDLFVTFPREMQSIVGCNDHSLQYCFSS